VPNMASEEEKWLFLRKITHGRWSFQSAALALKASFSRLWNLFTSHLIVGGRL
jgi:hypothetical protein